MAYCSREMPEGLPDAHPSGKGDLGYAYGWGVEQQVEGRSAGVGLPSGQFPRGFPGSEAKVESRQTAAEAT